jgi:hypothetical protein
MTMPRLEMPDVSGKTVSSIAVHDDPISGRELTIRFTDETELSVMIGCKQIAAVRHFDVKTDKTLFERDEGRQHICDRPHSQP